MALKVYALTCGHLEGDLGHLMEGGEGRIRLPIPSYLIEHPNGTALFDTGMHPDCQDDPASRVGDRIRDLLHPTGCRFANLPQPHVERNGALHRSWAPHAWPVGRSAVLPQD
jgi:hypothetical protein